MFNVLPIFKSHYSLQKSILTLEEPKDKKGNAVENSIFHILKKNNINELVLVEENLTGLLQASQVAEKNNIKLVFGLRIWVTDDINEKSSDSLKKQVKYIIFVKNNEGYRDLIKIWSHAAQDGFYFEPRTSFKTLKTLWTKNLKLVVPFYDSFLHLNSLESHLHVPDFEFLKESTFLIEDNNLPFDSFLMEKVKNFADGLSVSILPAQSIFYKSPDDFIAYLSLRCIGNRSTLEKPELSHMASDEFNFEKWLKNNRI